MNQDQLKSQEGMSEFNKTLDKLDQLHSYIKNDDTN